MTIFGDGRFDTSFSHSELQTWCVRDDSDQRRPDSVQRRAERYRQTRHRELPEIVSNDVGGAALRAGFGLPADLGTAPSALGDDTLDRV